MGVVDPARHSASIVFNAAASSPSTARRTTSKFWLMISAEFRHFAESRDSRHHGIRPQSANDTGDRIAPFKDWINDRNGQYTIGGAVGACAIHAVLHFTSQWRIQLCDLS